MKVILNSITQPVKRDLSGKIIKSEMSMEEYMIYVARISSPANRLNHETAPGLLKYLIDSKHWSPFEQINIAFEIETSRAMGREILRHWSMSPQEFSQRYAQALVFEPVELRFQAEKNRQSSTDVCGDLELNGAVSDYLEQGRSLYLRLLNANIAKECARFILPETTQTTMVMNGCLRSWIHFLDQRCSHFAQKEIRLIAEEIRRQLSEVCPWTAVALEWC